MIEFAFIERAFWHGISMICTPSSFKKEKETYILVQEALSSFLGSLLIKFSKEEITLNYTLLVNDIH